MGKRQAIVTIPKAVWGKRGGNQFHALWLYENCSCSLCVNDSGQKRAETLQSLRSRLDKPLDPLSVEYVEDKMVIQWDSVHRTVYELDYLRAYAYSAGREEKRLLERQVWRAANGIGGEITFDYGRVCKDPEYRREWFEALYRYGVSYLEGVPRVASEVNKLAELVGPIRNTIYGETFDVRSEENANNVAYTNLTLPLHMDLLYYREPPGLQFLHALENEARGGENTFSDVLAVVEDYKVRYPTEYGLLKRVPVTYHKHGLGGYRTLRRPILREDPTTGELEGIYTSSPFVGPLQADFDDVIPFYDAYEKFLCMCEDEKYIYERRLAPGEAVVFQNTRVLHARRAFEGRRHFRGTYVDIDELYARLMEGVKAIYPAPFPAIYP